MFKNISRTVWLLGIVSLFNDLSSEMLYPIMPLFLKSVGFSFIGIGLLEGAAEAIAGLSKIYFGNISDRFNKRKPFVQSGYGLSAVARIFLTMATSAPLIFLIRLGERLGKGIRTAPRDAILSLESNENNVAAVFGFHRAMDTIGACIGPLIALLLLQIHQSQYRMVFIYAAIPTCIAALLTFLIKESPQSIQSDKVLQPEILPSKKKLTLLKMLGGKNIRSKKFLPAIVPFFLFALVNSSDVFLLLFLKQKGFADYELILFYVFYNIVYALAAYPAGLLADRFGKNKLLIPGFLFFAIVYLCFYFCETRIQFGILFIIYGLYAACTEGNMRALASTFLGEGEKAAGLGFLAGWQSVALLFASGWTGFLWSHDMIMQSFIVSGIAVLIVAVWIIFVLRFRQAKL